MPQNPKPVTPEGYQAAQDFLTKMASVFSGNNPLCPQCSKPLTSAAKRGRCVYGIPCNCRMYTGQVPEWAKDGKP